MENYTIELLNSPFKYQEDIIDYFVKHNITINISDEVYYSHNLEATNKFFQDLKEVFKNPHKVLKTDLFKNMANDFIKGNLIVLEIDFNMIKYSNEESSKILLETNRKDSFMKVDILKILENVIESKKHYLLKFSKSGMVKVKVN